MGKTIALRFEIVRFFKKPALYALKTLNFKLTLPSLDYNLLLTWCTVALPAPCVDPFRTSIHQISYVPFSFDYIEIHSVLVVSKPLNEINSHTNTIAH